MNSRLPVMVLTIAAVAAYVACAVATLDEQPVGDVVFFLAAADKEAGILASPELTFFPRFGLWHPPVYIHLLALVKRFFGHCVPASRAIGIPCFLLSVVFTFLIGRRIRRENGYSPALPYLAICLLCISPLAVKGSVHLDIDNTLLTTIVLFFIYVFLCVRGGIEGRKPWVAIILLSLVFAGSLWIKMTTPWALLPTIVVVFGMRGRLGRGFLVSAGIGVLGAFLFMTTWLGYCAVREVSWRLPFEHLSSPHYLRTSGKWR